MPKKKSSKTKPLEIYSYEPPKFKPNEKNIKALEVLMNDEAFKQEVGYKYSPIIDAYKAGKNGK